MYSFLLLNIHLYKDFTYQYINEPTRRVYTYGIVSTRQSCSEISGQRQKLIYLLGNYEMTPYNKIYHENNNT